MAANGASLPMEPATEARAPGSPQLKKHADYQRVYREGRRGSLPLMTYFYALRPGPGGPRIGITAGRVLGNAVERNRIKRRMRAAIAQLAGILTAAVDLALHPRRPVLDVRFPDILRDVERALRQVQAAAETAARSGGVLAGEPLRPRPKTGKKPAAKPSPKRP